MSTSIFQIANSNYTDSGSISFGTLVSRFGRVAKQSGTTVESIVTTEGNTYINNRFATMSLYNPSLILMPLAVSSSTLFTLYCNSGSMADFSVVNSTTPTASLLTRVGSYGFITTSSNNTPRIDYFSSSSFPSKIPSILVEPLSTNQLLYSQDFTQWSSYQITVSSSVSDTPAPDGTFTANKLIFTTSSAGSFIYQSLQITSSITHSYSCFIKNNNFTGSQRCTLYINSSSANFSFGLTIDPSTQETEVGLGPSGSLMVIGTPTSKVENYGNGWYRYSISFVPSSSMTASPNFFLLAINTSSLFAWGAQLEANYPETINSSTTSHIFTSYIPTTATTQSRNRDEILVTSASRVIGQTHGTIYCEFENIPQPGDRRLIGLGNTTATQDIGSNTFNRIMLFCPNANRLDGYVSNDNINLGDLSTGYNRVAFTYRPSGSGTSFSGSLNGNLVVSGSSTYAPLDLHVISVGMVEGATYRALQWNSRIRHIALYTSSFTNDQLRTLSNTSSIIQ